MLPKPKRLTSGEVEDVMSKGQSVFGDFFLVKFLKSESKDLRVSALSPKKFFTTAVLRNKTRRRIYSALSPIFKKNLIKNSFLIAIVCNKKVITASIQELSSSIEQVFTKSGIL